MNGEYVEERAGGLYVAASRVSLASIVYAFRQGASPETIRESYPSLTLAQVYGAVAFYLNHPAESEAYLEKLQETWNALEKAAAVPGAEVQARLDVAHERLAARQR